ncbi:protein phosphatase 1 regulatory inhibitor subunit PPP1R7 isoform X1 [Capsicum galapagoense]
MSEEASPTLLDLTSYQLHDLESVELPLSLTELDLTTNRLSALDPRIPQLPNLKKLSFRQNLITDAAIEPLSSSHLISHLEELVLRDNKLKKIPDVAIFKKLLVLDVSFNEISSLNGLSKVSSTLRELYVSKNDVTKMEEIEHFHELQILELGSNRLRVMELLENMKNLQELWLGRNRIRAVNLCGLKCIKKISLQSNRLTSMNGFQVLIPNSCALFIVDDFILRVSCCVVFNLQGCVALEELYLSHNGIAKMEGLSTLVNLRVLDVSANKLTEINDIENLTKLEDLWLNDNNIASLEGLAKAIAGAREKLTTIYLERNPCVQSPNYTSTLRHIFPNIEQIDSEVYA